MNTPKHIILVPVYNDWKSLNKLLYQLNEVFRNYKKFKNEILIVNDDSSEKINIKKNNLLFIKKFRKSESYSYWSLLFKKKRKG